MLTPRSTPSWLATVSTTTSGCPAAPAASYALAWWKEKKGGAS